jgi:SEC-C motif-containing protein
MGTDARRRAVSSCFLGLAGSKYRRGSRMKGQKMNCLCGSGKEFSKCCEPYLSGEELPATSEALMRSRYCAFARKNFQYLRETHDPQSFDPHLQKANEDWANSVEFLSLVVLKTEDQGNKGLVEFKVNYRDERNQEQIHHEISRFRKQAGRWYYKEGRYPQVTK